MSCDAPVRVKSILMSVTAKIPHLSFKTILLLTLAKDKLLFFLLIAGVFLSSIKSVGKTINEITDESAIPADIIHPRLMMGWICEKSKDEKPAIVVKMAKNVGVALESMVVSMSLYEEAFGYLVSNS